MNKNMDIYTKLDDFIEENEGQVTLTDVAKHFAEHGYQYAVDKACEWLTNYFVKYLQFDEQIVKDFRKAM